MTDLLRQEVAALAETVVVKVGTRVLTCSDGRLDRERIADLAEQVSGLMETGRRVVMVSSGAVGAGISRLQLAGRPTDLAKLQAVAAVGQTNLVEAYDQVFRQRGRHAAQILLTADDLNDRTRYLNVRNTILELLEMGVVPVINENDTVAVDELMTTFGDNDRLAALVTNLIRAPLLVILSDVAGVFDGDPRAASSRVIPTISQLNDAVFALARDQQTGLSKGGMASKLKAAQMITSAGENAVIAGGREPNVLRRILDGESVGTLIVAQGKAVRPFKRWIAFSARPRGKMLLDDGACQAVKRSGRSLLAIGITEITGRFEKGDVVSLCDSSGRELARGLTNYSSAELARIRGLRSDKIAEVLGHCPYEEVIHRDNLATLG